MDHDAVPEPPDVSVTLDADGNTVIQGGTYSSSYTQFDSEGVATGDGDSELKTYKRTLDHSVEKPSDTLELGTYKQSNTGDDWSTFDRISTSVQRTTYGDESTINFESVTSTVDAITYDDQGSGASQETVRDDEEKWTRKFTVQGDQRKLRIKQDDVLNRTTTSEFDTPSESLTGDLTGGKRKNSTIKTTVRDNDYNARHRVNSQGQAVDGLLIASSKYDHTSTTKNEEDFRSFNHEPANEETGGLKFGAVDYWSRLEKQLESSEKNWSYGSEITTYTTTDEGRQIAGFTIQTHGSDVDLFDLYRFSHAHATEAVEGEENSFDSEGSGVDTFVEEKDNSRSATNLRTYGPNGSSVKKWRTRVVDETDTVIRSEASSGMKGQYNQEGEYEYVPYDERGYYASRVGKLYEYDPQDPEAEGTITKTLWAQGYGGQTYKEYFPGFPYDSPSNGPKVEHYDNSTDPVDFDPDGPPPRADAKIPLEEQERRAAMAAQRFDPPEGWVEGALYGLGAGARGLGNGLSNAAANFVTIGGLLGDPDKNPFKSELSAYDRAIGAGISEGIGTVLGEGIIAVGTGGLSAGSKAAKAVAIYDAVGNTYQAGSGAVDIYQNGANAQNLLQTAGGAIGLGGQAAGRLFRNADALDEAVEGAAGSSRAADNVTEGAGDFVVSNTSIDYAKNGGCFVVDTAALVTVDKLHKISHQHFAWEDTEEKTGINLWVGFGVSIVVAAGVHHFDKRNSAQRIQTEDDVKAIYRNL